MTRPVSIENQIAQLEFLDLSRSQPVAYATTVEHKATKLMVVRLCRLNQLCSLFRRQRFYRAALQDRKRFMFAKR